MLDTARVIFTNLQAESKDIPVTGKYIEAVAAIGLVLLEITQVTLGHRAQLVAPLSLTKNHKIVKKDEEIASSLGSHIWPLAILLEGLSKRSRSSQGFKEETTTQVAGIRSELDSVREKIKNWCFLGAFMRTSSPGDPVEAMFWKVLEDIPVSHDSRNAAIIPPANAYCSKLLANLAPQTQ
ncbi:hypothetical protein FRC00_001483 [Tulasnella sp. 408]|nr:hypothetical protein FRC00_001483 [Tulasnella sp. 408]